MVENLVSMFLEMLNGLSSDVIIFVISMVPILELRGGIIAASILGVPIIRAVLICILGNILPIPFILLFIKKIFAWLRKLKPFEKMVQKLEDKALSKSDTIQKYEFIGILLFVGIPLPGTGAWTGALIAALLDVKLKKAVPAIFCGILLASAIMCVVSYLIPYLLLG